MSANRTSTLKLLTALAGVTCIVVSDASAKNERSPLPLGETAKKGIAYLVNQQGASGGWGQGGGWRQAAQGGRYEGVAAQERADVGNTAVAVLALLRAGHTPKKGQYAQEVTRGIDFICGKVEKSDAQTLQITDVMDTQIQMKIGRYVDTFLASMVLSEVKGEMPDETAEKRLGACLDKVVAKIEKNQRSDGSFAGNDGWASTLSEGLATKGLNRARTKGAKVSEGALARAQGKAEAQYDDRSGRFVGGAGDAGVSLYSTSANLSGIASSVEAAERDEDRARQTVASPAASAAERREAEQMLGRLEKARKVQKDATRQLAQQINDPSFVSGFGSNGGEEFLSYMNISETLLAQNDPSWNDWHTKMTTNLTRVQNGDGSWSGHHCITGRTFVTATALLVLLSDRAPAATSAQIRRG